MVNLSELYPFIVILSIILLKGHSCFFPHSTLPLQSRIDHFVVPTALYLNHSTYFISWLYMYLCVPINAFIPVLFLFSTLWALELTCLTSTLKFMRIAFVKVNCSLIHKQPLKAPEFIDILLTALFICIEKIVSDFNIRKYWLKCTWRGVADDLKN